MWADVCAGWGGGGCCGNLCCLTVGRNSLCDVMRRRVWGVRHVTIGVGGGRVL